MMAKQAKQRSASKQAKAPIQPMSDHRRLEVVAQFSDDVLSKLAMAFFQALQEEGWGKRDLSAICGINETAIGHILSGRRKNITVESIALLSRAMRTRPELVLHDLRLRDNNVARLSEQHPQSDSAADALNETQVRQSTRPLGSSIGVARSQPSAGSLREPEAVY
jgi:hypothetical protein